MGCQEKTYQMVQYVSDKSNLCQLDCRFLWGPLEAHDPSGSRAKYKVGL